MHKAVAQHKVAESIGIPRHSFDDECSLSSGAVPLAPVLWLQSLEEGNLPW